MKPLMILRGPYGAPFIGDLGPIEILQHAQVISPSAAGAILHHQMWKALTSLSVHGINRFVMPPVTVFFKTVPVILGSATAQIGIEVQSKGVEMIPFNQSGQGIFGKLDDFGVSKIQDRLAFA